MVTANTLFITGISMGAVLFLALLVATPLLFYLGMDRLLAGTVKDAHTWAMLQTIAADPQKLGTVILAVVFTLVVGIFILAPLGAYLMRGGKKP